MKLLLNFTTILPYVVFSIFASCSSANHPIATSKQYSVLNDADSSAHNDSTGLEDIDYANLALEVGLDPENALRQLDDLLALHDAPRLHLLFGQASLNLLEQRQMAGTLGPGLAADLFSDADSSFEMCVDDPNTRTAALRGQARSLCRQGDFVNAWDAALLWHASDSSNFELSDNILIGEIGLGRVIAERQQNASPTPAPHLAIEALEAAIEAGAPYATRINLADFHTWQQRPVVAAEALASAILSAPDSETAYTRLSNLCTGNRNLHTATLKQLCFELSNSATALWYYGESLYLQARDTRAAADFLKAMLALDQSEQAFEQAAILNEAFATSCRDYISIVKTQRVWLLRDEQRIDDAIASVLDVIAYNPVAMKQPRREESLPNAIDYLVSDIYKSGDLVKATAFLRSICLVDDSVSSFVNNLGLFTRDLAGRLERSEQPAAAHELYLESWDVYSRLVELEPDDPRAINDRALISVYYLDDHHEFAVQELHRAIVVGEDLLAKMDDNVPESEHLYIDEAVGDAYENLAYYQVFRLNQVGDAEKLLKISETHYPFKKRNGVMMIREKIKQIQ
jgi:tetratricopeptide (TPR) repeat protein